MTHKLHVPRTWHRGWFFISKNLLRIAATVMLVVFSSSCYRTEIIDYENDKNQQLSENFVIDQPVFEAVSVGEVVILPGIYHTNEYKNDVLLRFISNIEGCRVTLISVSQLYPYDPDRVPDFADPNTTINFAKEITVKSKYKKRLFKETFTVIPAISDEEIEKIGLGHDLALTVWAASPDDPENTIRIDYRFRRKSCVFWGPNIKGYW